MPQRMKGIAALCLGMAIVVWLAACALVQQRAEPSGQGDPLAARGFSVTQGAAPGYIEDRACGMCHSEIFQSYQSVGMANSFYRPSRQRDIEDFGKQFFHEASGRYYKIVRRGEKVVFRRHQLDEGGQPINVFEQEIDWVLGSGNHSRTYLYQTASGELYQLPLAWYTQTRAWGMAPGFDNAEHLGVRRRVQRQCMFCHNAYPDVPQGSDVYPAPHVFPASLPEGTGCQRCHGPGAEHVRAALRGGVPETLRGAIVNPARLPRRLRDEVCYQCHFQPSAAFPGVRRFERADYSFRPGEPLASYLVKVDIREQGQTPAERFEINHHPYRLEQSRCYRESEGALSCLTCHDPHRKVTEENRAEHYSAACRSCHERDDLGLSHQPKSEASAHALGATVIKGAAVGQNPAGHTMSSDVNLDDCVSCHMPKRRTQDVVPVVMTDHYIRRTPGGPELLAALEEKVFVVEDVKVLDREGAPQGKMAEIYRTSAVLRATGGMIEEAVEHLRKLLAEDRPEEVAPYFDLARGLLRYRRYREAVETLESILERSPAHPLALEWLGLAWSGLDEPQKAVTSLQHALRQSGTRTEAHFNLGRMFLALGRTEEAVPLLLEATRQTFNLAPAWHHLGQAHRRLQRPEEAVEFFRRSLEIDPSYEAPHLAIGETLMEMDRKAEAIRYLKVGRKSAGDPAAIEGDYLLD